MWYTIKCKTRQEKIYGGETLAGVVRDLVIPPNDARKQTKQTIPVLSMGISVSWHSLEDTSLSP